MRAEMKATLQIRRQPHSSGLSHPNFAAVFKTNPNLHKRIYFYFYDAVFPISIETALNVFDTFP